MASQDSQFKSVGVPPLSVRGGLVIGIVITPMASQDNQFQSVGVPPQSVRGSFDISKNKTATEEIFFHRS